MNTDIAIIGAGPYGLSLAAHLREKGWISVFSGDRWPSGVTMFQMNCA
ncbi:hypothetical protein RAA17_06250 [Komagataeibacter rhaeticus]|nr:hypothetical protein [Komagataeibacter rhaeticus]